MMASYPHVEGNIQHRPARNYVKINEQIFKKKGKNRKQFRQNLNYEPHQDPAAEILRAGYHLSLDLNPLAIEAMVLVTNSCFRMTFTA